MAKKKSFFTLNKIIILLGSILAILVGVIMIYLYGGQKSELSNIVSQTSTVRDAFHDYDVVKKFSKDTFHVEFRDLITSSGDNERHYRYDLTISTKNKRSAEDMIMLRKQVISIINRVMASTPTDEINTEPERARVKKLIQTQISRHYPGMEIKEIYFTNFLYN